MGADRTFYAAPGAARRDMIRARYLCAIGFGCLEATSGAVLAPQTALARKTPLNPVIDGVVQLRGSNDDQVPTGAPALYFRPNP